MEWFRPRFFIMENVQEFKLYRSGELVRQFGRILTVMGYQVTFIVL